MDSLVLAAVGVALCLAMAGSFDSSLSNLGLSDTFGVRIGPGLLTGGVTIIVACAVLAVLAWKGRVASTLKPLDGLLFAAVQAVSVAALVLGSKGVLLDAAADVGGLVLGASSIVLLALWARSCSRESIATCLAVLAGALLLLTVVNLALSLLPDIAAIVFGVLAAAASPLLLSYLDKTAGNSASPSSVSPATPSSLNAPSRLPWWLTLVVFIAGYGIAMGCVQSLGNSFETDALGSFLTSYSINIGALVTAGVAMVISRIPYPRMVLRLAILVTLVAALYFSGVFGLASGPAGMLFMTLARMIVFLLIWVLACCKPQWDRGADLWSTFAMACGWGVFTLANTFSTKVGLAVAESEAGYLAYNIAVMVVIAALIALELVSQRIGESAEGANGGDGPAEVLVISSEQALEERCRVFGEANGLTAREIEVLVPLMKGRSAATIATILGVSPDTARTHIRHIYAKTEIHNREDLMDAIEATELS